MSVVPLPPPAWRDRLQLSAQGAVKNSLFNALLSVRALRDVIGDLHHDEFRDVPMTSARAPWRADPGPWTDADDVHLAEYLQGAGIPIAIDNVRLAVDAIARENPRHELREWLSSLRWDGHERIGDWLTYYLGAERTAYTQAVGRAWLISAVARVFEPGCQADHMLIIDGPQGVGKSTALRILTGRQWFTDEIADFGSKDSAMQLSGAWVIEVAELAAFGRAAQERIKAFITRTTDRYRPPYGKRLVTQPRQCVFAGTSNDTQFVDPTGNRRFWPVSIVALDRDALAADRDQIWAETVAAFRGGEPHYLTDSEVIQLATGIQEALCHGDPWEGAITEFLAGINHTTMSDILSGALKIPIDRWTRKEQMRVASYLKTNGWQRVRVRRFDRSEWVYKLPVFPT